jgi:hypothetical protein
MELLRPAPSAAATRSIACAALIAIGGAAGSAQAAATWMCTLSGDGMHLVCAADRDAADAADTIDAAERQRPPIVVNGTRFPLDPAQVYTVDLWAPPTEPAFVQLLARSTICYRSADCEVLLGPSPWLRAEN